MKLLLDQNISRKLVAKLETLFPGMSHVFLLGLQQAADSKIWEYAKAHEYTIVTQDSDFSEYVTLFGHPPKVIWLRTGNTSSHHIEYMLSHHKRDILEFERDTDKGCLILW